MRMWMVALVVLAGCADATGPEMQMVDTSLAALKGDVNVPAICQVPGHANSPQCQAALGALGISATYLAEVCPGLAPACYRAVIGAAIALQAWDNGIDQHGHDRGYEIGGNGGERQDEGLRVIWPGDPGYDPEPPMGGQDGNFNRYWWGGLRQ